MILCFFLFFFKLFGSADLVVSSTTFIDLKDTSRDGGAIMFQDPDSYFSINDCNFINCSTTKSGGAIYITAMCGNFTQTCGLNCYSPRMGEFYYINIDGSQNTYNNYTTCAYCYDHIAPSQGSNVLYVMGPNSCFDYVNVSHTYLQNFIAGVIYVEEARLGSALIMKNSNIINNTCFVLDQVVLGSQTTERTNFYMNKCNYLLYYSVAVSEFRDSRFYLNSVLYSITLSDYSTYSYFYNCMIDSKIFDSHVLYSFDPASVVTNNVQTLDLVFNDGCTYIRIPPTSVFSFSQEFTPSISSSHKFTPSHTFTPSQTHDLGDFRAKVKQRTEIISVAASAGITLGVSTIIIIVGVVLMIFYLRTKLKKRNIDMESASDSIESTDTTTSQYSYSYHYYSYSYSYSYSSTEPQPKIEATNSFRTFLLTTTNIDDDDDARPSIRLSATQPCFHLA